MEPAFSRTAIKVFALDWHHEDIFASFDVLNNWIGNEIFLVARAEVVVVAILHDTLKKGWRHNVFADINEIAWCFLFLWLFVNAREFTIVNLQNAIFLDIIWIDFGGKHSRISWLFYEVHEAGKVGRAVGVIDEVIPHKNYGRFVDVEFFDDLRDWTGRAITAIDILLSLRRSSLPRAMR